MVGSQKKLPLNREKLTPLEIANRWTQFKICGKLLPRLTHEAPGSCEYCGARPRKLHNIPCKLELSPCGLHEYIWDCDCPIEGDE